MYVSLINVMETLVNKNISLSIILYLFFLACSMKNMIWVILRSTFYTSLFWLKWVDKNSQLSLCSVVLFLLLFLYQFFSRLNQSCTDILIVYSFMLLLSWTILLFPLVWIFMSVGIIRVYGTDVYVHRVGTCLNHTP